MDRGPQMLIDYFFNDKTVLSVSLLILKKAFTAPSLKPGALVIRRRQHICSGLDTVSLLPMDSLMQY